jgi:hypothetical protein
VFIPAQPSTTKPVPAIPAEQPTAKFIRADPKAKGRTEPSADSKQEDPSPPEQ